MTNNDILRRLRYAFNDSDSRLAEIFTMGGLPTTISQVVDYLRKEHEPGYVECEPPEMECFLNGLIIHRRGPREGAPPPQLNPDATLTNNDVLKKLRIALELQEEDMLNIMSLAGVEPSKHELSALFRKDGHKHYKECGDQFMRQFLKGLTEYFRNSRPAENSGPFQE